MQKTSMLETANFRATWPNWPHPFLTMPTQNYFDQLLIWVNLHQHAKNQFIPSVHSSDTVSVKVPSHDWPNPFLIMWNPKTFQSIFMKLYQHAKNKLIPLVNSILEFSNQIGHINMLKWYCFFNLLARNCSFRYHAIWLAEKILAYISGTRIFS